MECAKLLGAEPTSLTVEGGDKPKNGIVFVLCGGCLGISSGAVAVDVDVIFVGILGVLEHQAATNAVLEINGILMQMMPERVSCRLVRRYDVLAGELLAPVWGASKK